MLPEWQRYVPGGVFALGCALLLVGSRQQQVTPLAAPLASLPTTIDGYTGIDQTISDEEQRVAGMSSYVLRAFTRDSTLDFTVYVGYYDHQVQGKTIHSPKNCLPGAGWEAVASSEERLGTALGPVSVNRYFLVNGDQKALVYYWYQGRGRVEPNEYRVKLQLLRDSALRGRTEEALVRVVVPVHGDEAAASALGRRIAARLVPEVARVLPAW